MPVKLNAEETMRDRERVALFILDQISQFTALLDTDGRVLEVNRAASSVAGWIGKRFSAVHSGKTAGGDPAKMTLPGSGRPLARRRPARASIAT